MLNGYNFMVAFGDNRILFLYRIMNIIVITDSYSNNNYKNGILNHYYFSM